MNEEPQIMCTPIYGRAVSELRYVPAKDGSIVCMSRVMRYNERNEPTEVGEWEELSRMWWGSQ